MKTFWKFTQEGNIEQKKFKRGIIKLGNEIKRESV